MTYYYCKTCSPRTELAAGPADEFQKPLMVVANFCGDAVTEATIAACSLPPVVPPSPAAAGPTWSAVACAASVSTLTERQDHSATPRAVARSPTSGAHRTVQARVGRVQR